MTWPRIVARFAFWQKDPPPAVMLQILAVAWGWEAPKSVEDRGKETMETLAALFPTGKI